MLEEASGSADGVSPSEAEAREPQPADPSDKSR
jgi:hypothetical protein